MDDSSVETTENWLVGFGCSKCADQGITPPLLAQVIRWWPARWEVSVRVPRIGLPRPGNDHDVEAYVRRYSRMHPEEPREEVAGRAAHMLLPNAANLRLARGQFAPAPIRGRVIVGCDRGHRVQTTAASLIRLSKPVIPGGRGEVETRGCGLLSLRVRPLRAPAPDPWDEAAFT